MIKKRSLRFRLTVLSAVVMISVAIVLTAVFSFSADRLFVKNLSATLSDKVTFSQAKSQSTDLGAQPFASTEPKENTPSSQGANEGVISVTPTSPTQEADQGMLIKEIQVNLSQAGQRFNLWGIAGLILVTLLGIVATWLMAGRMLKPVRELSDAIELVGDSDLTRRVDDHGMQDEIGQLARSFNTMMDKVSASFQRQKRFSASAAHELKTPLATIQVGLDVLDLDENPDPVRMKKALAVTRTNTTRMIRLMEDLFKLSAAETYDMDEEMPVNGMFAEILEELSPLVQAKNLEVSAVAPPDLKLTGNRSLLYRAVFNLVENAAKYNRDGGKITVSAGWEEDAVVLGVADNGIGIPPEDLPHIFEPFYRVDTSRSRAMGGAGLGLSLVQEIIHQHGGSIKVESVLGQGTTLILRFPSSKEEDTGVSCRD